MLARYQWLSPILLIGIFTAGFVVYQTREHLMGSHFRDEETERRAQGPIILPLRLFFTWFTQPLVASLRRIHISPDTLTIASLVFSVGAAILIGLGMLGPAAILFVIGGMMDFLDGRVARSTGQSSQRGAALDSILDRYSDAVVLTGVAYLLRDSWAFLPTMAALIGSLLVSYNRARGASLGVDAAVGLMQRPERVVIVGLALVFDPMLAHLLGPFTVLSWSMVILALGTQLTAFHRLRFVYQHLDGPSPNTTDPPRDTTTPSPTPRVWAVGSVARSTTSSAIATASDFALVLVLASSFGVVPWFATAIGTILGAVVNFSINAVWAFKQPNHLIERSVRYTLVSALSAVLNAGGVALVLYTASSTLLPVAWIIVRVAVFLFWNYPMHKHYVFAPKQTDDPPHDDMMHRQHPPHTANDTTLTPASMHLEQPQPITGQRV